MSKFVCYNCGEMSVVNVDGYAFGDREMEGILFQATYKGDEIKSIHALDAHKQPVLNWSKDPYLYKFKKKLWINEAKEYFKQVDIVECSVCGENI